MSNAIAFKIATMIALVICLLLSSSLVNAQAMGFESESNSLVLVGGKAQDKYLTIISYGDRFKLKKGDFLDVDGQLNKVDLNNPTVHPTLEIMKANHQVVEFVSDPVGFNLGGAGFCKVHDKFKHFLNKIYGGRADDLIHQTYQHAGMHARAMNGKDVFRGDNPNSMVKGVSQSLQVTFSFNFEKCWTAVKVLSQFLVERKDAFQANQPFQQYQTSFGTKVIRPAKVNFAQLNSVNGMAAMIEFIDSDLVLRRYSDATKFFVFNMFQYLFTGAISDQCNLAVFAKSITGAILLRTDFTDFISYGGDTSVKSQLGLNAKNIILSGWSRFVDTYLKKYPNSGLKHCTDVNDVNTYFFAKKYDIHDDFPFTANEFLDKLFTINGGTNLFLTHNKKVFDNAFSRFKLNANNPLVIFEMRTLESFNYNQGDYTSLQEFSIYIPTLFNIGNEIQTKNANFDLGLKSCHDNLLVPYTTQLEFQIHAKHFDDQARQQREQRRAVEGAIANMRQNRRAEQNNQQVQNNNKQQVVQKSSNVLAVSNNNQRVLPRRKIQRKNGRNLNNQKVRNTNKRKNRTVSNNIRKKVYNNYKHSNNRKHLRNSHKKQRSKSPNKRNQLRGNQSSNKRKISHQRKKSNSIRNSNQGHVLHRKQSSNARTLSIDPNESISLLREERRKIRVQKRFDREERREIEVKNHMTDQTPTPEQIEREKVRLAREKKRLAREEERDIKEGATPVSAQQLEQIANKQSEKLHTPSVQPKPNHTIRRYRTKNDDLVLEINLNYTN